MVKPLSQDVFWYVAKFTRWRKSGEGLIVRNFLFFVIFLIDFATVVVKEMGESVFWFVGE